MAGQQLWSAIKPDDDAMLHEAPVLAPHNSTAAGCYDALGEGHQLLQQQ